MKCSSVSVRNMAKQLKGYLHYKTITSQNVPSEAQIKNFLFRRKNMFRSQDIQVFVFLTIPWFTKSVTSRWVLVHETRCIFEYIFWTTTHEVTKLGQLIDISKDNNSVISWTIKRTETRVQVLFNLATCPNYSITKYFKIPVFHFFEKVNKGQLKMVYVNH